VETKRICETKKRTPTFLLELPLQVNESQAARLRAHLEAGRQFYNAVLSEGQKRLRQQYGFSEYGLHEAAKQLRASWIAERLDAVLAQTLASRAYRALSRLWLGQARRVRFKSRGRGLSSIENKRNVQRQASSLQAKGADALGFRYAVQLVLEGVPHHKPKHPVGSDIIGADLGPSTIALFPREGEASLSVFCEELAPNEQAIRRLQRKMDRQRRAPSGATWRSSRRSEWSAVKACLAA
jgi:hypothetical protein